MGTREIFGTFTPREETEFQLKDFADVMRAMFINKYAISYESEGCTSPHYHLFINVPAQDSNQKVRARLHSQLPKGDIYLSNKDVRDKVSAIAYTMKDGFYIHNGIDVFTLMEAKKKSFKKVKFDDAVDELRQKYNEHWTKKELVQSVIDIYKATKKKPYDQHIMALCRSIMLEKNENYEKRYVERLAEFL